MDGALLKALNVLNKPGVIVTPTETVIGISCSALAEDQIDRIYQIKQRPNSKAFIVLVDSIKMIKDYSEEIGELEIEYLTSERPTTVILKKIKKLPINLIAKDGSLAFRITKHPDLKRMITELKVPIVSTSANISGNPTALLLKDVDKSILEAVDYSLNLQSNYKPSSQPSRIVKIQDSEVEIIRS